MITHLVQDCPATLAIYIPSQLFPVSGSSGKIIVPFFGGDNDIEAVLLGLNFSLLTNVVIVFYSCVADSSGEDDFLRDDDKKTLDFVQQIASDSPNIEFSRKKCKTHQQILEHLETDLHDTSLTIVGLNFLDYFPHNETNTAFTLGNVAAFVIQHQVNLMVVNKSKVRPNYPFFACIRNGYGRADNVRELINIICK